MTLAIPLNPNERLSKQEMFMKIAEVVATRSTCSRLQVGCVITNIEMTNMVSMGYNGNYAGGPNGCDGDEPGKCGCLHAEINALVKNRYGEGKVAFVTDAPCINCAKAMINAGIEVVYYRNDYRLTEGIDLLKEKIKVIKI